MGRARTKMCRGKRQRLVIPLAFDVLTGAGEDSMLKSAARFDRNSPPA